MMPTVSRRVVLGGAGHAGPDDLTFPVTQLARQAHELITETQQPFLRNHSLRSLLFGRTLAAQQGRQPDQDYDAELMFLIRVLHDTGLSEQANTDQRFEVAGADFAARFLEDRGVTDHRVDIVWDAIALHTSPSLHESPVFQRRRAPEIGVAQSGIGVDIVGGPDQLPPGYSDRVHAAYPRHGGARAVTDAIVEQARANPRKAPDDATGRDPPPTLPITALPDVGHHHRCLRLGRLTHSFATHTVRCSPLAPTSRDLVGSARSCRRGLAGGSRVEPRGCRRGRSGRRRGDGWRRRERQRPTARSAPGCASRIRSG